MMRYPGGKLRLMKKIDLLIAARYPDAEDSSWVVGEPFTGGGGSLVNMAERFPHWKFHLNDLNSDVYRFWKFFAYAPPNQMQRFYTKIRQTKPNVLVYNRIFSSKPKTDFDAAFRLLFLNKTSFGGYITQNLPIGGKGQASKWGVGVYWNPANIIQKCQRVKDAISGRIISVTNQDCVEFVQALKGRLDFLYADPPYMSLGEQWYDCRFDIKSLTSFRAAITNIPRWCISIDNSESTQGLFNQDIIQSVAVKHTSQSRNKTINIKNELVVFKGD